MVVTLQTYLKKTYLEGAGCDDEVTVAVALPRLNSEEAYFVAGILTIAEHEQSAVLRAPRVVAEWLRDAGTFTVTGADPAPDPVQIIEAVFDHHVLETATVLWEPADINSVYGSFSTAVLAAQNLTGEPTPRPYRR
jgi:hypothetical protein